MQLHIIPLTKQDNILSTMDSIMYVIAHIPCARECVLLLLLFLLVATTTCY